MTGSLTVVGTGYKIGGQVTIESLSHIRIAERVLANVDPVTHEWLVQINPAIESLRDCYAIGKRREHSYKEMVGRILSHVRAGYRVCAVFYGHPGIACDASYQALKKAREEGFQARMLPGISAEDCLVADLEVDASHGCQHFEAARFLISRFRVDVTRPVILWQAGAVGERGFRPTPEIWNRGAFDLLVKKLMHVYTARHRVFVYEASPFPVCGPTIRKVALAKLGTVRITISSTIYIPPLREVEIDTKMLSQLNLISNVR